MVQWLIITLILTAIPISSIHAKQISYGDPCNLTTKGNCPHGVLFESRCVGGKCCSRPGNPCLSDNHCCWHDIDPSYYKCNTKRVCTGHHCIVPGDRCEWGSGCHCCGQKRTIKYRQRCPRLKKGAGCEVGLISRFCAGEKKCNDKGFCP